MVDTEPAGKMHCNCGNMGSLNDGWFVHNQRTGGVRCTKCGSYDVYEVREERLEGVRYSIAQMASDDPIIKVESHDDTETIYEARDELKAFNERVRQLVATSAKHRRQI